MLKYQRTVNFYAQSIIKEEGKDDVVLSTMDASINNDGSVFINKTVASNEVYNTHKETIEKDWSDFEAAVSKDYSGDVFVSEPVVDSVAK